MKIELVNPIPELISDYENAIIRAIAKGWITLEEWNTKYANI